MATSPLSQVIQHLRSVVLGDGAGLSDGQLLQMFVKQQDQAAFTALVRRHGSMVWGVCQRVLRQHHDAEDAFQATFLVLVRKAATIRNQEKVASWLYGVACQTARKARAATAKRQGRERQVMELPEPTIEPVDDDLRHDLLDLLDQELSHLPDKYRLPIILCDLEGRSIMEATRNLGWPQGTLATRLARGRAMLAKRLARHGLTLTGGTVTAALAENAGSASVSPLVVFSTIQAASLFAAGQEAVLISARVATLTTGVIKAMFLNKLMKVTALLVLTATGLMGAGLLSYGTAKEKENKTKEAPPQEVREQNPRPAVDHYGDPLPPHAVARLGTLRFRWPTAVLQAAVVPGGKQLLGLDCVRTVVLWDAVTGREVRRFEGPTKWPVNTKDGLSFNDIDFGGFAVSPDGKTLAVGTADKGPNLSGLDSPLLLFDLATGRNLAEWPGHSSHGHSGYPLLAFVTPALLVSAGDDGLVRVWDVTRQRGLGQLAFPAGSHFSDIVPSPDRKHVFVAGGDDKESFWTAWEAATGKLIHQEKGLPGASVKLAVSPDGASLALAMGMGSPPTWVPGYTQMRLYSVPGWNEQRRWEAHRGDDAGRCSITFSPDGKTIATGGADDDVRRWDAVTGKEIGPVIDPVQPYSQNVAYLDATTLVTFGFQDTVKFWDAATSQPKRTFTGSEVQVWAVAFTPDGKHAAVGGGDAPIRIWDVVSSQPVVSLLDGPSYVKCLEFSPDGQWLVSGDTKGRVRLWDWARGSTPVKHFSDPSLPLGEVDSVAFSPDAKNLAIGDQGGIVRVWAVSTGKLVHTLKTEAIPGHPFPVTALAFTADGQTLYTSPLTQGIRRWNLATGKEVTGIGLESLGHSNAVSRLVLSPGARWGCSSSYDGSICVWEAGHGLLARVLQEREPDYNGPVSIALSPDGTRLAAGFQHHWENPSVHLWDLTTGQKVATLTGHQAPVSQIAFSRDGRRLVSGSYDTTALVWDISQLKSSGQVPDDKALAGLWKDLGSSDPKGVYAAVCRGAAAGDLAVARLKVGLKPAVVIDPEQIGALVRHLDSDEFAQREKASQGLADLGPVAETPLREALEKAESPEIRRRLEGVLEKYEAEYRRLGNAVEILEMIGSPAARRLLMDLAKGASSSRLTREARVAIDRLEKRP